MICGRYFIGPVGFEVSGIQQTFPLENLSGPAGIKNPYHLPNTQKTARKRSFDDVSSSQGCWEADMTHSNTHSHSHRNTITHKGACTYRNTYTDTCGLVMTDKHVCKSAYRSHAYKYMCTCDTHTENIL